MAYNLKNPEDVQEYLKNIYLEYKFGCEGEKNGNACHLLGDYEEAIKQDHGKAAQIYKNNCDERNWPRSCAKYAGYVGHGKGCEKDMEAAFKYMKKSCDLNDPMGCVRAGTLAMMRDFKFQENRAEQVAGGLKMLIKACDEFNQEQACFQLSSIYLGSRKDDININYTEAHKFLLKSCDAGNPFACANLSQMYMRGEGVEQNDTLAMAFKEKSLALNHELKNAQKQLQFGLLR